MTPDMSVTQAIRTLHRTNFEGVSEEVLEDFYKKIHFLLFKKAYSHLDFTKANPHFDRSQIANWYRTASSLVFDKNDPGESHKIAAKILDGLLND